MASFLAKNRQGRLNLILGTGFLVLLWSFGRAEETEVTAPINNDSVPVPDTTEATTGTVGVEATTEGIAIAESTEAVSGGAEAVTDPTKAAAASANISTTTGVPSIIDAKPKPTNASKAIWITAEPQTTPTDKSTPAASPKPTTSEKIHIVKAPRVPDDGTVCSAVGIFKSPGGKPGTFYSCGGWQHFPKGPWTLYKEYNGDCSPQVFDLKDSCV